jgi:hypothetical protein
MRSRTGMETPDIYHIVEEYKWLVIPIGQV